MDCEMLATKTVEIEVGNEIMRIITTQGGALSPLLWSLKADKLLDTLINLGGNCQGYGDDIVIIPWGKFEGSLCDRVQ